MYYMDSKHAVPYMDCMDHGSSSLFRSIPAEANVPIAVNPDEMMSMKHGSEHKGTHRLPSVLCILLLFSLIFTEFSSSSFSETLRFSNNRTAPKLKADDTDAHLTHTSRFWTVT